ncbi:MAG: hypothetical protein E7615_01470 [Ruminococcaceae bacterium]|nr:hypothetical protein [Oscillospiraceae bacterium]
MKKLLLLLTFIITLAIVSASESLLASATKEVEFDTTKTGAKFDAYSLYSAQKPMNEIPVTYEAWIKAPTRYSGDGGVIYGNSGTGTKNPTVRIRVTQSGYLQLYYNGSKGSNKEVTVLFDGCRVNNGKWTHIAIVDDLPNKQVLAYIDGELKQTKKMETDLIRYKRSVNSNNMCIGGDYCTGQTLAFKGEILSVAVFSDVRTADEIKADMKSISLDTDGLISCYDLAGKNGETYFEDLTGKYTMANNRTSDDWLSADGIEPPKDFAYSIAVLGDTQIVSAYFENDYHLYFDWLLENKEKHKIEHVLNLGDMTNFNKDSEWENVRKEYFRLNGIIDYTLVRGDHDIKDDNIANNGDDTKKYDRYFGVDEYLTRLKQPDSDYYKGDDGSITNSYRAIEIGGNKYLIVTLDKNASKNVLAWADAAMSKYPEHKIILTTHCYLEANGKPGTDATVKGTTLFNQFKKHKNLEMIISGHMYAYGVVWTKQEGTNGNVINQLLVNPQGQTFDANGATCMIAMLYFSADGTDVEVRYYSAYNNSYYVANHNPVEGVYNVDSSCFKISTDNMEGAVKVDLTATKEAPSTENEGSENNSEQNESNELHKNASSDMSVWIYVGICVGVLVIAVVAVILIKKNKK